MPSNEVFYCRWQFRCSNVVLELTAVKSCNSGAFIPTVLAAEIKKINIVNGPCTAHIRAQKTIWESNLEICNLKHLLFVRQIVFARGWKRIKLYCILLKKKKKK